MYCVLVDCSPVWNWDWGPREGFCVSGSMVAINQFCVMRYRREELRVIREITLSQEEVILHPGRVRQGRQYDV